MTQEECLQVTQLGVRQESKGVDRYTHNNSPSTPLQRPCIVLWRQTGTNCDNLSRRECKAERRQVLLENWEAYQNKEGNEIIWAASFRKVNYLIFREFQSVFIRVKQIVM